MQVGVYCLYGVISNPSGRSDQGEADKGQPQEHLNPTLLGLGMQMMLVRYQVRGGSGNSHVPILLILG